MMNVNNYSFISCICGMKIKVPAGFGTNRPKVTCPRCGQVNDVISNKVI